MTKKKRKFKMAYVFIALVVAFCLYVSLGPKLSNMNEGMWEITVETKMPGMEMSIPSTHSQLLTKADPVPHISIPNYECRLFSRRHSVHIIGNFVLWKVHCEGPGPDINGTAYIRYSGDTLKGSVQMGTIEDGQKNFKTYISGFRTGDGK